MHEVCEHDKNKNMCFFCVVFNIVSASGRHPIMVQVYFSPICKMKHLYGLVIWDGLYNPSPVLMTVVGPS